jgi:hypothetical protein
MPKDGISIDEYLSKRKDFVKSNGVVMKAAKAPTTWNDETRSVVMVMSTDQEDRDKDIVVQAGIDIADFLKNPVAPFAHRSYDFPVGTWSGIKKDLPGTPRRTEGLLTLLPEGGDANVDRLAFHMKHGAIRTCSIGFKPTRIRRREEDEDDSWPGYEIIEATLFECSPCMIPANPGAMAKSIQGNDEHKMARDVIEEILDTWAKHPETGLLVPRADFETAYKELTGNKVTVSLSHALLKQDEIEAIVSKSNDSVFDRLKKFFVKEEPPAKEPVAPKLATAEAKAAVAARVAQYRGAQAST